MIAYTVHEIPKWNPINICSYHLQEAGATPVQELAYALCTAIAVLDAVRDSGQVSDGATSARSSAGSRSSSTPACGSSRRCARCAPSCELWDELTRERYGVDGPEDAPVPLRRAGQLARPHRGAAGEQRAAHRARDARRDAVARTPAPAPSSCRPGTRRSACRGRGTSSGRCGCSRCWPSSPTCSSTTTSSTARTWSRPRSPSWSTAPAAEIDRVQAHGRRGRGGRVRLHEAGAGRARTPPAAPGSSPARRWSSASTVFETTEPSPLTADLDARDPGRRPGGRGGRARARVEAWKAERDEAAVAEALAAAGRGRQDRRQPDARHPGRAPAPARRRGSGPARCARCSASSGRRPASRGAVGVAEAGAELDRGPRAGADDRRGARRPAAAAGRQARPRRALQRRRAGRRPRPRRRLRGDLPGHPAHARADRRGRGGRGRALRRPVDPVRLAHGAGARRCSTGCARPGSTTCRSSSAGSSPTPTPRRCSSAGVAAVFTPKDFGLTEIMGGIVDVIRKANDLD